MNERVQKIVRRDKYGREVIRGSATPAREKLRMVLIGIAVLTFIAFLRPSKPATQQPESLSETERAVARDVAKQQHISLSEAEAQVIAIRPTDEDRRRWAYQRSQRESDIQAMQAAVCKQSPWLDRCQ